MMKLSMIATVINPIVKNCLFVFIEGIFKQIWKNSLFLFEKFSKTWRISEKFSLFIFHNKFITPQKLVS